jgi:acetyltransferase
VAIIGASNAPGTVGAITMRNLLQGGFKGPIMPVNPKYQAIQGVLAYKDVHDLPLVPDLAVLCVPPDELPGVIGRLGERGCPAAVIITSSLDLFPKEGAEVSLSAQVLHIAQSPLV